MAVRALPLAVRRARATSRPRRSRFDGACLRGKCEADHELGYQLMRRFAALADRAPAGDPAAAPRRLRPCPRRLSSLAGAASRCRADGAGAVRGARQAPGDRRHVDARARRRARRRRLAFAPGQFTMLSAFGAGEVPISISGDPAGRDRSCTPSRAVGLATEAICRAAPGEVLGVRGPFGRPWPIAGARGRRRARRRRRHRPGAAAPGDPRAARTPRALRAPAAALRRPLARPAALHRGARASGPRAGSTSRSPSTAPGPSGSATSASCRGWSPRRASTPASAHGARVRARGDDALHRRRARAAPASPASASTPRWSATCSAGSATAATASSARRSSAATGRSTAGASSSAGSAIREL